MECIVAFSAKRYVMADMDHYLYLRTRRSQQCMYLRCRETTCHGSMNWHLGENRMYLLKPHNHLPVEEDYQELLFRQSLRHRASVESSPIRTIFVQEKQKNPVGARRTTFKEVSRLMYRARQAEMPPIPSSLQQFDNMIIHQRWFSRYGNELGPNKNSFYKTMLDSPLNPIIVFVSENIRRYVATLEDYRIHLDYTFKVVTKSGIGTQLFIIHLYAFETVFPLLLAFMQNKSEEGYLNTLQYLQKILSKEPSVVVVDYEENLRNVVGKIFPNSTIMVGWIHYARAIFKKSLQLGLQKNDKQKELTKYSMMLPLLPHNYLQEGLSYLENEGISELFLGFLRQQWEGQNIPAYETDQRVNNSVESFNRSLFVRIGQPIPNIWALLDILRFVEQKKSTDLQNLIAGRSLSKRKRPRYLRVNRQVEKCTHILTKNNDVPQFLISLNNLTDRLVKLFGATEDLASLYVDTNTAKMKDPETPLTVNVETSLETEEKSFSNSEIHFGPTSSLTANTKSIKRDFDDYESITQIFETSDSEEDSSCEEDQQGQGSDVLSVQDSNMSESYSSGNISNIKNIKNKPPESESVSSHQIDSILVTNEVETINIHKHIYSKTNKNMTPRNVDDRSCVRNNLHESNSDAEYESRISRFYDDIEQEVQNEFINVTIQPFKKPKTSAEASEIVMEIDRELVKLIILKHSLSANQIS